MRRSRGVGVARVLARVAAAVWRALRAPPAVRVRLAASSTRAKRSIVVSSNRQTMRTRSERAPLAPPRADALAVLGSGVEARASRCGPDAGLGLFVTRAFARRELITLYDGEILTRAEAWARAPRLSHMAAREGVVVDGVRTPRAGRGGGSFANAADSVAHANATIEAQLGRLVVRARTPLAPGDEVLVYYGRRGFALSAHSD